MRARWSLTILVLVAPAVGCADPCRDDGLGQKACPADGQEGDGGAEGSTGGGTGDATDGGTVTGTGDGSDTNAETTTDTDPGTGTADTSDTGPGDCENGMQDGDETDVDCGGSCGRTCKDGDDCLVPEDCINDNCVEDVCGDPVCNPEGSNSCQGCLQQECCDAMVDCFADEACTCWFECISHNNDFAPCQDQCAVGNVGPITSCANSRCNYAGACAG